MTPRGRLALFATFSCGVAVALAGAYAIHANAAGIPEADALTYTGYLEGADGVALSGAHSIAVYFYATEAATKDLCSGKLGTTKLVAGRFQVPLPAECVDAVKASPDIWVGVEVDGSSLGRTKLGLLPYALEAGHATNADAAAQLNDHHSAFRATLSKTQAIPKITGAQVAFDKESFDLGDEFDESTGTFSPKIAGFYQVQCAVAFEQSVFNTVGYWAAGITVNGVTVASSGGKTDGQTVGRSASALVKLKTDDEVACLAWHEADGSPVARADAGTNFQAVRQAAWE